MNTESNTSTSIALSDFALLDDFARQHSNKLSPSQLRWLARHRDINGLAESGAIVCVSRKLYVHATRFSEWFAKQRG
ncbi:MAG: hypothetical protein ACXV8I_11160 [Methylobacter sp.]